MLQVSEQVKTVCTVEGISQAELGKMVQLSSPLRDDPHANRRFYDWVFKIGEDQQVERMARYEWVVVGRGQGHAQIEECPHCLGDTCTMCGYRGEIMRRI